MKSSSTSIFVLKFEGDIIAISLHGYFMAIKEYIASPNDDYRLKDGKILKSEFNFHYMPPKIMEDFHKRAIKTAKDELNNIEISTNISKMWMIKGQLSGYNRLVFAPSAYFVKGKT